MLIPYFDLRFESQFSCLHEHGLHSKWKNQQKRWFTQLKETLNDFVIGTKGNLFVVGKEALESQASGL